MHRHGAVALFLAVLAGAALHAALAATLLLLPALERSGLDPFLRLLPALISGALPALLARPPTFPNALARGALAGSVGGFTGMLLALCIGAPHGPPLPPLVSVTGTSVLFGALGGAAGWGLGSRELGARELGS